MVDYLRGLPAAATFLEKNAHRMVLSSIVVAELYAGVEGEREQEELDAVIAGFPIIPITADIAKEGGLLRSRFGKSHGVGLLDAILAATVLIENAELATLNVRHYPMVQGLKPAYARR